MEHRVRSKVMAGGGEGMLAACIERIVARKWQVEGDVGSQVDSETARREDSDKNRLGAVR